MRGTKEHALYITGSSKAVSVIVRHEEPAFFTRLQGKVFCKIRGEEGAYRQCYTTRPKSITGFVLAISIAISHIRRGDIA
jgi:hypothetical protein